MLNWLTHPAPLVFYFRYFCIIWHFTRRWATFIIKKSNSLLLAGCPSTYEVLEWGKGSLRLHMKGKWYWEPHSQTLFLGKPVKWRWQACFLGSSALTRSENRRHQLHLIKGRKRILTTIKKDLAAIIKKVFKTASRCKNDDEGQEDMERESSKWWRLELSSDCPVSCCCSSPGKQLWEKEDQHTCPPGEVYIFKWFASVMNIKVKQVLREQ